MLQTGSARRFVRTSATFWEVPKAALLAPEVFKAIRRQFGVARGVLDVPMAEIGLQGPRIVALVGQGEATGVPQHDCISGGCGDRRLTVDAELNRNAEIQLRIVIPRCG